LPALVAAVRAAGTSTWIDSNWDPDEQWDGGLLEALRESDILFANGEEVTRIARVDEVEAAARTLATSGPLVVVKLGREGAIAAAADDVAHATAPEVDGVDTVRAGRRCHPAC